MKKSAQITFFVIIGILLAVGVASVYFLTNKDAIVSTETCHTDSDCVPATCCHADSCVLESQKPDCSEIFCTLNCEPGTLDCAQGSCECINSKCEAVLN